LEFQIKWNLTFLFLRTLVSRVRCNPESLHAGLKKTYISRQSMRKLKKNGKRNISNSARLNKAEVKLEKL
jgi:hypothetical protein